MRYAEETDDYHGGGCVFRDSVLAADVAKMNPAAILEQGGLARVRGL